MKGPVGVPVAPAAEAVAYGLSRERQHRCRTAKVGERRLALEPFGVVFGGDQQGGGRVGAHSPMRGQGGNRLGHQTGELLIQFGDLLSQPPMATSNRPHRQFGRRCQAVGGECRDDSVRP